MVARYRVFGRHPVHRLGFLLALCGAPVTEPQRYIVLDSVRDNHDLCRACFSRDSVIRLGRNQRAVVRRALNSRSWTVYPVGKREAEAVYALVHRKILVRAPALPGAYRIASERLAIHLRGSEIQHRKES